MIINTGSRTDIPAYYSDWFYNRIKEGYVLARNPYNPTRVLRYRLSPDVVDCITFCTKNPAPMLPRLKELESFRQYWFVTITPYGKDIEPHVPEKEQIMDTFLQLSNQVKSHAIDWRYDPIFLSETYPLAYHVDTFEKMASRLKGATKRCVISFIDLYAKTRRNFPEVREVKLEEQIQLAKEFVQIGKQYGITIYSCCEGDLLAQYGVDIGGCLTKDRIEQAIGCSLNIPKKKPAREGCDCILGSDIGGYNTCGHGCIYCYANYDRKSVLRNMQQHDPNSPYLIGHGRDEDLITEVKQESYLDGQLSFL